MSVFFFKFRAKCIWLQEAPCQMVLIMYTRVHSKIIPSTELCGKRDTHGGERKREKKFANNQSAWAWIMWKSNKLNSCSFRFLHSKRGSNWYGCGAGAKDGQMKLEKWIKIRIFKIMVVKVNSFQWHCGVVLVTTSFSPVFFTADISVRNAN